MKLVVVRHLKTQDGIENRFCSGDRDIPVLEIKEDPYFAEFKTDAIGHTGLTRTEQTAIAIAKSTGYSGNFLVFPELRERIGGNLRGCSFKELQGLFPEIKTPAELWKIEAPEMGLESLGDFLNRIGQGLRNIQKMPFQSLLLVAHAGTIKGVRAVLNKQSLEKARDTLCGPTPESLKAVWFTVEVI